MKANGGTVCYPNMLKFQIPRHKLSKSACFNGSYLAQVELSGFSCKESHWLLYSAVIDYHSLVSLVITLSLDVETGKKLHES